MPAGAFLKPAKKIYPKINENIFWWLEKQYLSLPLNSWAKFWETKNGENGLNSEVLLCSCF